jgi:hypothetical protein
MTLIRGMHDLQKEPRSGMAPVWTGILAIGISAGLTVALWPSGPEPLVPAPQETVLASADVAPQPDPATLSEVVPPAPGTASGTGPVIEDPAIEMLGLEAEERLIGDQSESGAPRSGQQERENAATRRTEQARSDSQSAFTGEEGDEVVEEPAAQPGFLTVTVHTGESGSIYVDDQPMGLIARDTHIPVDPGIHRVRVDNNMKSGEMEILVESGQTLEVKIPELIWKPAIASISSDFHPDCTVELDGTMLGTIANIGGRFEISDPDSDHHLVMDCGGNRQELMLSDLKPLGNITIAPP